MRNKALTLNATTVTVTAVAKIAILSGLAKNRLDESAVEKINFNNWQLEFFAFLILFIIFAFIINLTFAG